MTSPARSLPRRLDRWQVGAILLFVGLPLLLAAIAITTLSAGLSAAETVQHKADMLARLSRQIGEDRARTRSPADTAGIYLASTSGSLARAEIQTVLTRLVSEASGHLMETQTYGETEDTPGRVAIQATLDLSNEGLMNLLYAIETGLPVFTVSDLGIRRTTRPEGTASEPSLRVTLVVRGYWRSKVP